MGIENKRKAVVICQPQEKAEPPSQVDLNRVGAREWLGVPFSFWAGVFFLDN